MYLIESDRPTDERLVDVLLGVLRTEEAVLQTVRRGQAAEWVQAGGARGRVQVLVPRGRVRLRFEAEDNLRIFP